jgi:hypothetical protein
MYVYVTWVMFAGMDRLWDGSAAEKTVVLLSAMNTRRLHVSVNT